MNKVKKEFISFGTLGYQDYETLIEKKFIYSKNKIPINSLQPASIDLRLGSTAYEISASFLAIRETVESKLKRFKLAKINIENGFLFQKNITYLVELQEILNLNKKISGKCNPKSSTGRLDIFCRAVTDNNTEYEIIKKGYKGKIYLEITSKTFDIVFTKGDKLNQLRLKNGNFNYLSDSELGKLYKKNPFLFNGKGYKISPSIENGLKIKANISEGNNIIAYKAKKKSPKIIFNKLRHYHRKNYWIPINKTRNESIRIEPNEFYILKSKEKIRILPTLAAEMIPYDTNVGEFRVHYAGFFDPGFGNEGSGRHAVLELKTYEVPFILEDGQNIARLIFEKLEKSPNKIYGNRINSNYQNQSLALSKHFRLLD